MSSKQALDLDDYLWTIVFELVLAPERPSQDVLPLLFVCKRWKTLAKPLLYRHITLQHRSAVLALADTFGAFGFADETPARWTRSLLIGPPESGLHESGPSEDLNALIALVTYATGLIAFSMTRRSMPPSVLAVLQHPGRSQLKHLGAALCIDVPSQIRHISRFHGLQELRLWLPKIDNVDELIEDHTPAWTLPCLAVLDVRLEDSDLEHEQELLRFLVRCSFARPIHFSWINFDFVAQWETPALTDFLRRNLVLAHLNLRIIDTEGPALVQVLTETACPRVELIGPYLAEKPSETPLSPRIEELVLDCHWEGGFHEEWVPGVWRLLDAILQYHRDADALRQIMISHIAEEGSFGWLDDRGSNDEALTASKLASYVPKFRQKGIALLDGHGMALHVQHPPV